MPLRLIAVQVQVQVQDKCNTIHVNKYNPSANKLWSLTKDSLFNLFDIFRFQ